MAETLSCSIRNLETAALNSRRTAGRANAWVMPPFHTNWPLREWRHIMFRRKARVKDSFPNSPGATISHCQPGWPLVPDTGQACLAAWT
jgi:hypothetical protein